MDENSVNVFEVEDSNTFIQFLNMSGNISKTLYLAMHPEENDEAPHLIVFAKAGGNKGSANAGTVDKLPTAA